MTSHCCCCWANSYAAICELGHLCNIVFDPSEDLIGNRLATSEGCKELDQWAH